jgi:hypothetical protein
MRKAVVVAFAICGIGYVACVRCVSQHTAASGFYDGPEEFIWGKWLWEIGGVACLLIVAELVGEGLLRAWNRRPLTRWELLAAAPIGLLARGAICVSLYVTFLVIEFGVIYPAQFRF